jgi:hypothetical protein
VIDQFGFDHRIRMLGAEPEEAPLHLQILLAPQLDHVAAGVESLLTHDRPHFSDHLLVPDLPRI